MNQNGFRTGRSTLPQILTLRRFIEGIKEKQLPAILTFVDFSKAFDSIHRGKLMEILKAYGIPTKIVDAISILYRDTEAQLITPDGDTEFFEILAGVLQGDTLPPFLFIIALDYALREATSETHIGFTLTPRQSSRQVATYITDTDFADDLALVSDYLEEAQLPLLRLEVAAKTVGLHVKENGIHAVQSTCRRSCHTAVRATTRTGYMISCHLIGLRKTKTLLRPQKD